MTQPWLDYPAPALPACAASRGTAAGRRGWTARMLHRLLARLAVGRLSVVLPDGARLDHAAPVAGPEAVLVLTCWRPLRRLALEGDLGFAESYIDGDWHSPDLLSLLLLGAANQAALGAGLRGTRLMRLLQRLGHRSNANTRRGSRRNIEAHYDLGNAFYAAWLDRGMSYSSAFYESADQTMEAAQDAKQRLAIALLAAAPDARVLEIGCGWGGLAERLAQDGNAVTGLTLSHEQLAFARARIETAGLSAHCDLRLQDYRDTGGAFDAIVSIEMLEAVGAEYWPVYFNRLRALLRPGGAIVLQVITIADAHYPTYRDGADFIQRHIFPGGMLPSPSVLREQIAMAGLQLEREILFGDSYARTLAEWAQRFRDAWPRVATLGFDEPFRRKWEYYLAYCEAGFRSRVLDVGLYRIVRPDGVP